MLFDGFALIAGCDEITAFPKYSDRASWQNVCALLRKFFLKKGRECADKIKAWKAIPESLYKEYSINGIRSNFENVYFERRYDLADTVICECLDGKGKYLDAIASGLDSICGETSWCLPAHVLQNDRYTLDLFASDTAALVAITLWLIKDELNKTHSQTVCAAEEAIEKRAKTPYLTHNDYWWMGYVGTRKLSNWSSWISANMLAVFAFSERSPERIRECAKKAIFTLDKLWEQMPDDGECDEGVSYWNVSQAAIFDALRILGMATADTWRYVPTEKFKSMARYPYSLHIAEGKFANFGDCVLSPSLDYSAMYEFAKYAGEEDAARFAAERFFAEEIGYYYNREGRSTEILMFRALSAVFAAGKMLHAKNGLEDADCAFYERGKIVTLRTRNGSYFAVKGGGANGGHSHQDVCHFILYKNGLPIAIDVGTERYTKASFSSERNTLWYIRSAYHNLPIINGAEQRVNESKAEIVSFALDKNNCFVTFDATAAYPSAELVSYTREFRFGENLHEMTERMEFARAGGCVDFCMMCAVAPKICGNRICVNGCTVCPESDCDFDIVSEEIPLGDKSLRADWGEKIYRLIFRFRNLPEKFALKIAFE